MPTWSALDLAEPRSPCRDAQRQRRNCYVQHRRSSTIKAVALATSITQKSHAFAHLFPLASMHLANPPQPSCNGQRASGNAILPAALVHRLDLTHIFMMHPQVCGSCCLLARKCFFDAPAHVCADCTCTGLEGFRARA